MILIVDDSLTIRLMLSQQLRLLGHQQVAAPADLHQARALLGFGSAGEGAESQGAGSQGAGDGHSDVEVLLLDMVMPETDGLTFLREVRAQPHLQDLSVLMVTGLSDDQTLAEAFAAGANDYLVKPCPPVVLDARVRGAQRATRATRALRARERELLTMQRALEQANLQLEALALTDGLTGLHNRRALDASLLRETNMARRTSHPLGLLLIDVDHFKGYNDRLGHPAGDACLREVAGALRQTARRQTDFAARYGGEEFALLLPDTDSEGLRIVAERACSAVRALGMSHPTSGSGLVTVSVGGALFSGGPNADSLLPRADAALYRAKQAGRDRVVLDRAPQEEEPIGA